MITNITLNNRNRLQFNETHVKERQQVHSQTLKQIHQVLSKNHDRRVSANLLGLWAR